MLAKIMREDDDKISLSSSSTSIKSYSLDSSDAIQPDSKRPLALNKKRVVIVKRKTYVNKDGF